MNTTATNSKASKSSKKSTIVGALAAMVAALAITFTVGVSPAHAFNYVITGGVGPTSNWTPTYVNAAPAYPVNSRVIAGPSMTVGRSASVPWNNPQKVSATFYLYRSSGAAWTLYTTKTVAVYINGGYNSAFLMADSLGSWARGYYYTMQVVVSWIDNYGRTTGTLTYTASAASDFQCTVSYCTPYNGGVLVN